MGCSHVSSVATPPPLYASPPLRSKSSREDRIASMTSNRIASMTSTLLTHNAIKPELKKPDAAIKGLDVPPGASESIWNVQPDALDVQPDDLETRAQALNKSVVLQRTRLHTAMERQLNGHISSADMEYQLSGQITSSTTASSAVTLDAAVGERRSAPRVLFNNSPFHIAAYTNDSAALKRQIDGKAAVNAVSPDTINSSKTSALHIAASQGALECIQVLVAAGANINVRNGVKATPLMLAVESGHDKCARALVAAQCEVNAKDARKQTALHWAARMSRDDSVKMLIDAKADVNSKCCAGYTPCAMAEDSGTHATWKLIEAAGGSRFP